MKLVEAINYLHNKKRNKINEQRIDNRFEIYLLDELYTSLLSLDNTEHQIFFPSKEFNKYEKIKYLTKTINGLIFLLSRAYTKNSVHMLMIRNLSEKLNGFHFFLMEKDNSNINSIDYTIRETELLLECYYKIMKLASIVVGDFDIKEMESFPYFKDEIECIEQYFDSFK